jgi:beta-glucosidase
MDALNNDFLWGASTAAHQIEGNNTNSDWWAMEVGPAREVFEPSGAAIDGYNRYPEDMGLLADAGLNAYRFSIEWARIEPQDGVFDETELAHYRAMIDTALATGLTPVVTLHHFTHPLWFIERGGWNAPDAIEKFARYVLKSTEILESVEWVVTINEPNVLTMMSRINELFQSEEAAQAEWDGRMPVPSLEYGVLLADAHRAAREVLHAHTTAKVGWAVACQALAPTPGNADTFLSVKYAWEDFYLEVARDDDFVGVQAYTSQLVDAKGTVPHPPHPENTLTGWAYRPDALGIALRNTADIARGVPILITENGIATDDDTRRIAYTTEALAAMVNAINDGIDVRGYLHWSALDNYEWGHWAPTFGLISVDRSTFSRTPKPSLAWLGRVAQGDSTQWSAIAGAHAEASR